MEGEGHGEGIAPSVDGYRVTGVLGRGGFATVFRAVQLSVGREVALKVLTQGGLDADRQRRFRHEVHAVGALSGHPHVVTVYDAGVTRSGEAFIALELVEGGSVGDRLRSSGPLPVADAVRIGVEVSDALGDAHEAGIIHRDIKPDNLLVGPRGRTLLTDFGIATLDDTTRTATGMLTGTLTYLAPELLAGGRPDARSDVFALGATLHALVSGRSPFAGDSADHAAAVMWRVANEAPAPLPDAVPPAVAALIDGCLEKDPAGRPTVEQLHRSLVALTAATPPTPPPPPVPPPPPHPEQTGGASPETVRLGSSPPGGDGTVVLPERPLADLEGSASGPPRRRRSGLVLAIGGLTVALVIGIALLAFRDDDPSATDGRSTDTASTAATTTTAPRDSSPPGPPGPIETFVVDEDPTGIAVSDGAVWVTHNLEGLVTRIDAADVGDRQVVEVALYAEGIVVDDSGRAWVSHSTTEGTVSRIDPDSLDLRTVAVGDHPEALATDGESVWVANSWDGTVARLDPDSLEATATVPVGADVLDISIVDGSLWASTLGNRIHRIDAVAGEVTDSFDVGTGPRGITGDKAGDLWVALDGEDAVVRVDPSTGEVTSTVAVGSDPSDVVTTPGAVWVIGGDSTLRRIDTGTATVSDVIDLPGPAEGIAVSDERVWVTIPDQRSLGYVDL